jgi:hypothetical protein
MIVSALCFPSKNFLELHTSFTRLFGPTAAIHGSQGLTQNAELIFSIARLRKFVEHTRSEFACESSNVIIFSALYRLTCGP